MHINIYISLSIYLLIYLSIYLSIHLSIYTERLFCHLSFAMHGHLRIPATMPPFPQAKTAEEVEKATFKTKLEQCPPHRVYSRSHKNNHIEVCCFSPQLEGTIIVDCTCMSEAVLFWISQVWEKHVPFFLGKYFETCLVSLPRCTKLADKARTAASSMQQTGIPHQEAVFFWILFPWEKWASLVQVLV